MSLSSGGGGESKSSGGGGGEKNSSGGGGGGSSNPEDGGGGGGFEKKLEVPRFRLLLEDCSLWTPEERLPELGMFLKVLWRGEFLTSSEERDVMTVFSPVTGS